MINSFEEFEKKSQKCVDCVTKKFSGEDGKRHLLVCGGTGCLSSNSAEIVERLEALIKEHKLEDKVTVNKVGCFGFCSQGPFVKVLPEDTLYRMVSVEDTKEIFESDIIGGKIVERLLYVDPQTKQKVTKQDDITFYKKQVRIALHGCGTINPEEIEETLGVGSFKGLEKALKMEV